MHVNLLSGCRVAAANVVKLQNVQICTGHFMKPRFVFKKCKCLGRPYRLPGRTEARGRPLPASGSSWNGTEGPAVPWFPSIPVSAPGERRQGADLQRGYGGHRGRNLKTLTDGFLLRVSEYFCRKGTKAEEGSVASSGWRNKHRFSHTFKPEGTCTSGAVLSDLQASCPWISRVNDWRCPESSAEQSDKHRRT